MSGKYLSESYFSLIMKNNSHTIELLEIDAQSQMAKIRFVDLHIVMSLSKELLDAKLQEGFYQMTGQVSHLQN